MKNIINKTKAVVAAVLIVVMATLTSCYQKFEESWDLAIDGEQKTFSYEEGMFSVACYTTGRWTARLDRDIVWGHLENTSGHGTGYVRFYYTLNTSVSRSVNLILEANGKSKVIRLIQRTGIGEGAVKFNREAATYANGKYEGRLEIQTNLPDEAFADAAPILTFPESSSASLKEAGEGTTGEGEGTTGEGEQTPAPTAPDWITDVVYHPAEVTGTDDEGYEIKTKPYITYTVQPNTTGEDRVAVMKYGLTDAAGTKYYAEAILTQEAADGYIILNDTTINRDEQSSVRVAVETNLTEFIDEMVTEVVYPDGETSEYISNVQMTATSASFDIAENTGVKRIATIKVSYTDLNGNKTEGTLRVIQRGETIKRPVSAAAVRDALTAAGDYVYASVSDDTGDYADALELVVIGSGTECANIATNSMTAYSTVVNQNNKIAYVQTLDGAYGFRIDFAAEADNTLKRGDKFSLLLDGVKIVREDAPARYSISKPQTSCFDGLTTGNESDIATKEKSISELTDDDVYTEVTLTYAEAVTKKTVNNATTTIIAAPWTFGFESNIKNATPTPWERFSVLPTMVQDKNNDAIFALFNARCGDWRRNVGVPQGFGSMKGVIVHEKMKNVGNIADGNIGKYQIRFYDETSFSGVSTVEENATKVIAMWSPLTGSNSVNNYKFTCEDTGCTGELRACGYQRGATTNTSDPLLSAGIVPTNKMWATHGDVTDGSALFYSTNNTLISKTIHYWYGKANSGTIDNRDYPLGLANGLKGRTTIGNSSDNNSASQSTSICFQSSTAGFYEWDASGAWTGNTKGFVIEVPGGSITGKAAVSFALAPNCGAKYRHIIFGFPLYWKVECSIDGGNTWTACTNAITGDQTGGFDLHMINMYIDKCGYYHPITGANTAPSATTSLDVFFATSPTGASAPGAYIQQKFILPANAQGAAKVMVKISPRSLELAWPTSTAWNTPLNGSGLFATKSIVHGLAYCFEDVAVTCVK